MDNLNPSLDNPIPSGEELDKIIEELCKSKAEEFMLMGYDHVDAKDIWECASDKYKKTGVPALHQIVSDILSLSIMKFMNWNTMSLYRR